MEVVYDLTKFLVHSRAFNGDVVVVVVLFNQCAYVTAVVVMDQLTREFYIEWNCCSTPPIGHL